MPFYDRSALVRSWDFKCTLEILVKGGFYAGTAKQVHVSLSVMNCFFLVGHWTCFELLNNRRCSTRQCRGRLLEHLAHFLEIIQEKKDSVEAHRWKSLIMMNINNELFHFKLMLILLEKSIIA